MACLAVVETGTDLSQMVIPFIINIHLARHNHNNTTLLHPRVCSYARHLSDDVWIKQLLVI